MLRLYYPGFRWAKFIEILNLEDPHGELSCPMAHGFGRADMLWNNFCSQVTKMLPSGLFPGQGYLDRVSLRYVEWERDCSMPYTSERGTMGVGSFRSLFGTNFVPNAQHFADGFSIIT